MPLRRTTNAGTHSHDMIRRTGQLQDLIKESLTETPGTGSLYKFKGTKPRKHGTVRPRILNFEHRSAKCGCQGAYDVSVQYLRFVRAPTGAKVINDAIDTIQDPFAVVRVVSLLEHACRH